jgi:hypothetical protein
MPLIVSQRPFAHDPGRIASGRVAGLRTGEGEFEFTRAAQPLQCPGFALGQERVAACGVPRGLIQTETDKAVADAEIRAVRALDPIVHAVQLDRALVPPLVGRPTGPPWSRPASGVPAALAAVSPLSSSNFHQATGAATAGPVRGAVSAAR